MSAPGQRIVIESPLSGDFARNFRFLRWCCRAVFEVDRKRPIASHMLSPWFMNDELADERTAGIADPWAWLPDVPHWFFVDLGMSDGMCRAIEECGTGSLPFRCLRLAEYSRRAWLGFERGETPPHTRGFVLALEVKP